MTCRTYTKKETVFHMFYIQFSRFSEVFCFALCIGLLKKTSKINPLFEKNKITPLISRKSKAKDKELLVWRTVFQT